MKLDRRMFCKAMLWSLLGLASKWEVEQLAEPAEEDDLSDLFEGEFAAEGWTGVWSSDRLPPMRHTGWVCWLDGQWTEYDGRGITKNMTEVWIIDDELPDTLAAWEPARRRHT